MNREKALKLVTEKIKNQNLVKHCLAVEACMKALARHFNEGEETSSLLPPRSTREGEEDKSSSSPTELPEEAKVRKRVKSSFDFAIARENEEKWALTGLLHDIDYEETKDNPQQHSLLGAEILEDLGLNKEITEAVKTHNEIHGILPETLMAKTLFCLDPLTGLIVAATLVIPGKKINDLTPENILNRFKEKAFARGANREIIKKCSEIGLNLEEFVKISLKAMQEISNELEL